MALPSERRSGRRLAVTSSLRKIATIARHEAVRRRRRQEASRLNQGSLRAALESLGAVGYVRIERYWDNERVTRWRERLEGFYRGRQTDHVRMGGVRWHHAEIDLPDLQQEIAGDPFLSSLVKAYMGPSAPKELIFQLSYPDAKIGPMIAEGRPLEVGLGRGWHTDSWETDVKAMFFLSDISEDDGPFTYVPKSHHLRINSTFPVTISKFWKTVPPEPFDSNQLYFSREQIANLGFERRAVPMTGPAGTVVIADTRGVHHAAIQKSGERKVLWAYYS